MTKNNSKKGKSPSKETGELRQDIITGKWVVIATGRAKRPDDMAGNRPKPKAIQKYKDDCPFCNLAKYPQEPDVLRLPDDPEEWQVHIFGNKYPAFSSKDDFRSWNDGPYRGMESVGYHELLAPRWHNQFDMLVSQKEMALFLEALILRYRSLKIKPSVNYIQIIRNHGSEAGGSLEHPHHQIFTVPVLPSDVQDLLYGAENYYKKHQQDVFQTMLDFELSEGKRIVFENEHFVAFCPYASRAPFETWIMPKKANPFFETTGPKQRDALTESLQQVLGRLYTGLNDPPYNYYIHSAPCDDTGFVCDKETFKHFRWHIEIFPRLAKFGGFELGTGLEINSSLPEESAEFLRNQAMPNV